MSVLWVVLTYVAVFGCAMWGGGMASKDGDTLHPANVVAGFVGLFALSVVLTALVLNLA